MGKEGQQVPEMTPEFVEMVSARYIELFEKITNEKFDKNEVDESSIEEIVNQILEDRYEIGDQ